MLGDFFNVVSVSVLFRCCDMTIISKHFQPDCPKNFWFLNDVVKQ